MSDPYAVANLFQQPGEPWEQYKARIGDLFRAAPPVERPGLTAPRPQMRRDRGALLACLSADRWTTAEEIGARAGMSSGAAYQALKRACERGAPLERQRGYGWRLIRKAVAA